MLLIKSFYYQSIAGLWLKNGNSIVYSQEIQFTFWCPMRFKNFPLDTQICKFQVQLYKEALQDYKENNSLSITSGYAPRS